METSQIDNIKNCREFIYNSPELMECKARARALTARLNDLSDTDAAHKAQICSELFGDVGKGLVMKPPFYCDYGFNIHLGVNVLINYSCTFIDAAPIYIGDNTLIAPNVGIYALNHDLDPERRNAGFANGKTVTIGKNVWIGGSSVILQGVTIGDNAVIGAGSVVTKDIPAGCLAVGNPAKVIKKLL